MPRIPAELGTFFSPALLSILFFSHERPFSLLAIGLGTGSDGGGDTCIGADGERGQARQVQIEALPRISDATGNF